MVDRGAVGEARSETGSEEVFSSTYDGSAGVGSHRTPHGDVVGS